MAVAELNSRCLFVGIDSGGTRTNVQIVLDDGSAPSRTSSYEVGESLSGALASRGVKSVIQKIFAPLDDRLRQLGNGLPCFAWISAAGFSPSTRDSYVQALDDLAPTLRAANLKAVGVANDAVSLLLGSPGADGIVIAGTGSNTLVKSSDGSLYQAGGRDWVASDYGSGFWIGMHAIRRAYKDFEAGDESVLLHRLRDVYGIRPDDDRGLIAKLRDLSIGDENMKKEIARVAASVCAAAERGDLGAQNIVKAEAEELADMTAGSLRRRFTRDELSNGLNLVRCGSVIGNHFYSSAFESQVERRLLSGSDKPAKITWVEAATGREAAVELARRTQLRAEDLLRLSLEFRPAVVYI